MYKSQATNTYNEKDLIDMLKVKNLKKDESTIGKSEIKNKFKSPHQNLKLTSLDSRDYLKEINTLNLKKNIMTEIHLLKYRPKRLTKLKDQGFAKLSFSNLMGSSLDLKKDISPQNNKPKLIFQRNPKSQSLLNNLTNKEELLFNTNKNSEFKSNFIIKFAKNSENFNKLSNYNELINGNGNRRIFMELFSKISKLIENKNKIYLNNNEYDSNNNISIINNDTNSPKNPLRNKSNLNSSNALNNSSNIVNMNLNNSISSPNFNFNMKKLMVIWSDFISLLNKLLSLIFNELSLCKKENIKIKKTSYINELKLNNKENELEDLKKYLNRYDINKKINTQIQKIKEIKEMKQEFNKKENEYMLNMYRLKEENQDLALLLDRNKHYFDEYKNISKEIGKNKKQYDLLKLKLNKELKETKDKILIEQDYQEELKLKIIELNEIIDELKKEKEILKKTNIEIQAKTTKIEMTLNERNENICMLNEELGWYIRRYSEEKFHHENIRNELGILEKKFFDLEIELQDEKKKKNELFGLRELGQLIPDNYKNDDNLISPSPTDFTLKNNGQ